VRVVTRDAPLVDGLVQDRGAVARVAGDEHGGSTALHGATIDGREAFSVE
jgi:hypothetical protein